MNRTRFGTAAALTAAVFAQCGAPAVDPAARAASAAAWNVVYEVLQHPRCANCHPAGDSPIVGDQGSAHPQNVQRGADGKGRFAMRCATCHQTANTEGAHLPPGAPHWQMPPKERPMVFAGRTSAELCEQLQDPAQNGGRSPADLLHHVSADPLVLWGWQPGGTRAPVPVPHSEFVAAFRTWVEGGCAGPQ